MFSGHLAGTGEGRHRRGRPQCSLATPKLPPAPPVQRLGAQRQCTWSVGLPCRAEVHCSPAHPGGLGLDVTGPASHRNARVGPRGWGAVYVWPRPQGREPDLYFLSWGALGTDESGVCPLASAQGSESHGAPGLPGPRQGRPDAPCLLLSHPRGGLGIQARGGGLAVPILPLPPHPTPTPASSPWAPGQSQALTLGRSLGPCVRSPSSLTRGHHGLQIGSQASLGDGDGTDNALSPQLPGHPLWEPLEQLQAGWVQGCGG